MSIPVSAASGQGGAAPVAELPKSRDDAGGVGAKAHAELNVSIVKASLSVTIAAGNAPLALLYKSALTSINEALTADFGADAIQHAVSQDNTPEGTAGRIVSLSTAFYQAYRQQHGGEDEATTRQNFIDTIRGGVERGFKEARDILSGLQVLQGDIAGNIDKTYALVQQGLDAFLNVE
ncbi:MAG: DUF5610 domain-containing protein [Pseudomonadota bacterium]